MPLSLGWAVGTPYLRLNTLTDAFISVRRIGAWPLNIYGRNGRDERDFEDSNFEESRNFG